MEETATKNVWSLKAFFGGRKYGWRKAFPLALRPWKCWEMYQLPLATGFLLNIATLFRALSSHLLRFFFRLTNISTFEPISLESRQSRQTLFPSSTKEKPTSPKTSAARTLSSSSSSMSTEVGGNVANVPRPVAIFLEAAYIILLTIGIICTFITACHWLWKTFGHRLPMNPFSGPKEAASDKGTQSDDDSCDESAGLENFEDSDEEYIRGPIIWWCEV